MRSSEIKLALTKAWEATERSLSTKVTYYIGSAIVLALLEVADALKTREEDR